VEWGPRTSAERADGVRTPCRGLKLQFSDDRPDWLQNELSKKIENHAAAVALYFMYYNFGRVHQTLRVTPAIEAGVSDHVWSVEEIVALLETPR
jgi:hypothetical protein